MASYAKDHPDDTIAIETKPESEHYEAGKAIVGAWSRWMESSGHKAEARSLDWLARNAKAITLPCANPASFESGDRTQKSGKTYASRRAWYQE